MSRALLTVRGENGFVSDFLKNFNVAPDAGFGNPTSQIAKMALFRIFKESFFYGPVDFYNLRD